MCPITSSTNRVTDLLKSDIIPVGASDNVDGKGGISRRATEV